MAISPLPQNDNPFDYPAYPMLDCQTHLIDLLKSLLPKDMRPRFFDNKGYLGGLISLFDSFTPHKGDEKELQIFKNFISLLQSIETRHEETGDIPTDEIWKNLLKKGEAFLNVSILLTPNEFFKVTQSTLLSIERLIEGNSKLDHLKALGLANGLKWTGYFDSPSPFASHLTSLCKALDNFSPNPCPSFDAILKNPVVEELKKLKEILAHISV